MSHPRTPTYIYILALQCYVQRITRTSSFNWVSIKLKSPLTAKEREGVSLVFKDIAFFDASEKRKPIRYRSRKTSAPRERGWRFRALMLHSIYAAVHSMKFYRFFSKIFRFLLLFFFFFCIQLCPGFFSIFSLHFNCIIYSVSFSLFTLLENDRVDSVSFFLYM